MELDELERKYKELGEEIKRIKDKPSRIWYVTYTPSTSDTAFKTQCILENDIVECYTRQSNAFSAELEAARMAERFNLSLEINKFIKDNHGEVDWNSNRAKYSILYDHENYCFKVGYNTIYTNIGCFYFKSEQLAEKAIEIYGYRLKFAWDIT